MFSDILGPQLAVGRTIIDPTRFVADRELSRRYPELCYVTTRLAWLASEYFDTDLLLATVRADTRPFTGVPSGTGDLSAATLSIADQANFPDGARLCRRAGDRAPALPFFHSTISSGACCLRARPRWRCGRRPDWGWRGRGATEPQPSRARQSGSEGRGPPTGRLPSAGRLTSLAAPAGPA